LSDKRQHLAVCLRLYADICKDRKNTQILIKLPTVWTLQYNNKSSPLKTKEIVLTFRCIKNNRLINNKYVG
jgi:hypothetical protein